MYVDCRCCCCMHSKKVQLILTNSKEKWSQILSFFSILNTFNPDVWNIVGQILVLATFSLTRWVSECDLVQCLSFMELYWFSLVLSPGPCMSSRCMRAIIILIILFLTVVNRTFFLTKWLLLHLYFQLFFSLI